MTQEFLDKLEEIFGVVIKRDVKIDKQVFTGRYEDTLFYIYELREDERDTVTYMEEIAADNELKIVTIKLSKKGNTNTLLKKNLNKLKKVFKNSDNIINAYSSSFNLELWLRCKNGDEDARTMLFKKHQPLVKGILHQYINQYDEDVLQEGYIILLKTIDTYNGETPFVVHLRNKLRSYTSDYLLKNKRHLKYYESYTEEEVHDERFGYEDENIKKFINEDSFKVLLKYVKQLSPKEQQIISMKYGVFGESEHTYEALADKLHISKSQAERVCKKALYKVKEMFNA